MRRLALIAALVLLPLAASCKQRQTLPDALPGWHSPGYDTVTGRVIRVPAKDPTDAPTWILQYGLSNGSDAYGGEMALMPQESMVGYAGGELVQVKGSPDPTFKSGSYAGTWYRVTEIRIAPATERR